MTVRPIAADPTLTAGGAPASHNGQGNRIPRDFLVLLPPDWVRLPFDETLDLRISQLVNRQVQPLPAREREGARTSMTRGLQRAVADAKAANGFHLMLSAPQEASASLGASCLISALDKGAGELSAVVDELSGPGDLVTMVQVAGSSAVRRRRVLESRSDPDEVRRLLGLGPEVAVPPATRTEITFFVPVPGSTGLLVFAYTAALSVFAEPMERLFDAIMGTLRWRA